MPEDVVRKSFKVCGISVRPDGIEDSEIHCLKSGQVADAASLIVQQIAALQACMSICKLLLPHVGSKWHC